MDDRELLELAAEAAGVDHPGGDHCAHGPALWDCKAMRWWRPLTDDGDALRLAVKLGISIHPPSARVAAAYSQGFQVNAQAKVYPVGGDDCAATRRAIVLAAAAIGESKC